MRRSIPKNLLTHESCDAPHAWLPYALRKEQRELFPIRTGAARSRLPTRWRACKTEAETTLNHHRPIS